jgi:uncharacterized membrane protein YdjX (TVP38/TMEM64 family)
MRIDLKAVTRAVGIAVPIIFGLALGRVISPWLPGFSAWVHTLGVWAPIVYVVAYVLVVVLMMPAFLVIMAGGAVFGVAEGTALAMTGALVGGTCAFLIARYFARGLVEKRVAANPTLAEIDRVVGEDGMWIIFLLRLSPAIPFVLSNYALGVTKVKLRDYIIGTFGLIPIVLTYSAYGKASGAGPRPDGSSALSPTVLTVGIIATVVLGLLLARIVQKAIKKAELSLLQPVLVVADVVADDLVEPTLTSETL